MEYGSAAVLTVAIWVRL